MNEELDSMFSPHPPFPLSHAWDKDQLKIDPVRIDAVIYSRIGFDPIAVDIARIWFLGAKAPVDVDFLDTCRPKRVDSGT